MKWKKGFARLNQNGEREKTTNLPRQHELSAQSIEHAMISGRVEAVKFSESIIRPFSSIAVDRQQF